MGVFLVRSHRVRFLNTHFNIFSTSWKKKNNKKLLVTTQGLPDQHVRKRLRSTVWSKRAGLLRWAQADSKQMRAKCKSRCAEAKNVAIFSPSWEAATLEET